jgi:hypothetical protein
LRAIQLHERHQLVQGNFYLLYYRCWDRAGISDLAEANLAPDDDTPTTNFHASNPPPLGLDYILHENHLQVEIIEATKH